MVSSPSALTPLRKVAGFSSVMAAFGVSSIGDGVRTAALPLLAVTVTDSPAAIAGLAVAGRLPWLLVALFSGAVADRVDRRSLMVAVDVCRALVVTGLVAAVFAGLESIVLLYAVALLLGVGETLFDSATHGLIPQMVPDRHLARANGHLFTTSMVGRDFLGPLVGGWLFAVSRAVPFVVDAITFALGALLLRLGGRPEGGRVAGSGLGGIREMFADIAEGLRWTVSHKFVLSLLLVSTVVNLTQSAAQSLLVLLAVNELGMSEWTFGLLLTASGIGAFLGGLSSARVGDKLGVHRVLLPAIAVTPMLFLVVAWSDSPFVLGACLALNAYSGLLASIQMIALRQRMVPNNLQGRISSVARFAALGIAIPLGALAAGLVAQWLGVRAVYVGAAAVVVLLLVAVGRHLLPSAVRVAAEAVVASEDKK